jgi:heterodisulfide reductase subunit D
LKSEVIDELKKIVGASRVLTDIEDLYVYSFQGPLGARSGPQPNAVVKVHSEEESHKVIELAESERIAIVCRDKTTSQMMKDSWIMLDLTSPKDISSLRVSLQKHAQKPEVSTREPSMNSFSALKTTLSNQILHQKCRKCELASGAACSGFCEVAPFFDWNETWSAKGRTLLAKGLFDGGVRLTKKLVDVIFTCTTCGQCYSPCTLEQLDMDRCITFARREIVRRGMLPECFRDLGILILEQGSPIRTPLRKRARTWWFSRLDETPKQNGGKVLYWIGCLAAYRFPNIATATINVLRKGDVDFMTLGNEEGCCGLPLYQAGLWDEAKENAVKTVEKLEESGAEILVTGCAGCYYAFKKIFPEVLGVEMPLEVLHTSQFIEQMINDCSLSFNELRIKATYHDPCDLGRHCGVYEPPRNVIRSIPGAQLVDMNLNRSHERCCGGGGGLWTFNPDLAGSMAYSLLLEEVLSLNVEAIITACPMCYMNLKYTSRLKKIGLQVYDLAELVEKGCQS